MSSGLCTRSRSNCKVFKKAEKGPCASGCHWLCGGRLDWTARVSEQEIIVECLEGYSVGARRFIGWYSNAISKYVGKVDWDFIVYGSDLIVCFKN